MRVYEDIKKMLCDELDDIAKAHDLTPNSLEIIDIAIDIIKDISVIESMEEYSDGYRDGYSGRYDPVYDDGMNMTGRSYARGRGGRRDSQGRYPNDGYSGDTREELKKLMDMAPTDREREALRAALNHMDR